MRSSREPRSETGVSFTLARSPSAAPFRILVICLATLQLFAAPRRATAAVETDSKAAAADHRPDPSNFDPSQQWPQWRGPFFKGAAPHADPPVEWSESKNVRWKVALPGKGHSTPVVWNDRVFVTTAVAVGEAF